MGSYFKGSMANHMKWNNVSLPLGKMPDEIRDRILNVSFHEGVDALKKLLESADDEERQLGATLPAEFFPIIAKCNNDPYMNIISARVVIGSQFVQNIFSVIENKLLDIFMILEKEFGNLDSLDIDVSGKSELVYDFPEEKWEVVRERESKLIKDFCNSGKMIVCLLSNDKKECEFQVVDEILEASKWLYLPTGKLLAVNASELIQCVLYPELEMEKIFELEVERGWYAISMENIEKIKCSLKTPLITPFENIQE